MIIDEKCFKYCLAYFFLPSTHSLKEPYMAWEQDCGVSNSQSSKTPATHSNVSDWQIFKNKQEFSNFWVISYRFVQIVMLIRIQMHFVLLTTISLLFVGEGHFWIIFKKSRGSSPQSPPFCTCLVQYLWVLNAAALLVRCATTFHTCIKCASLRARSFLTFLFELVR